MNVLNEAREMKARGKLRVRQTTKKKADHKNQLDPSLLDEMERAGKIRKMKVSKEMNQHRM
jgi:hypothetical protein